MKNLPQINPADFALLKKEVFDSRIDWHQSSRMFGDWKSEVGAWVRDCWHLLDRHVKLAIAMDAYLRARDAAELAHEQQR